MNLSPVSPDRILPALAVALLSQAAALQAQDDTLVRQLGQSSPGFHRPVASESTRLRDDLQRSQEDADRKIDARATAVSVDGAPIPWWEGMEEVAIESMDVKDYTFGVKLTAGWEYDDNLILSEDAQGANSYYARPEASYSYIGNHWKINARYIPEFRYYDTDLVDDTFNQIASGSIEYSGAKSNVALTFSFADTDGANIEVGSRVESIVINTGLNATYEISPKTIVGGSLLWEMYDYDDFNSYDRYTAKTFADYKITEKTFLGLGVGYEYVNVDTGADSDAYSAVGRVAWQFSPKLGFRGNAGAEYREYDGGNSSTEPVFSLGFLLVPREGTTISVDGYRRNSPSIGAVDQNFYSTGVAAVWGQRITSRVKFDLIGGFESSSYDASVGELEGPSQDGDYWFVRPQFTVTVLDSLVLSLFYQYSENTGGSVFERNFGGASLSYSF